MSDSIRWEGFEFRDDDIVISTPPKCGTTWTQMLCALLIFQDTCFEQPLAVLSPWLDQQTASRAAVVAELEAQEHRRFIKTHTPLDGIPFDERVTYLCVARDPRDVAISIDHHWANMDFDVVVRVRGDAVGNDDLDEVSVPGAALARSDDPVERFRAWVDNDTPPTRSGSSLWSTLHHIDTFWKERALDNVALFHYSDLEADLGGEMERLAGMLQIEISRERIRELAPAASFARMKARAADVAPNADVGIFRDIGAFFSKGESGQWRAVLGPDDLAHYDQRVRELVSPDLAHWIHHGYRGA
jgi:hypothetical protein